MTTIAQIVAVETENRDAVRRACGNANIQFNAYADADFAAVAAEKAAYYAAKAAGVSSEAAKAKWLALAAVWAEAPEAVDAAITVVIPAGNLDSVEDAYALADAYRTVAAAGYPGAQIDVTVLERQHGGGSVRVEIDGENDEIAADALTYDAERLL